MSQVFSSGIFPYADGAPHIVNDVSAVSIGYFVNRTPLVSRLNRVPVGSVTFRIVGRQPRQRTTRLSAAIADNTNTTVPVTNASLFMLGDVLQLATGERVEITAKTVSNNTTGAGSLTVRRGVEGTTAAAQTNNTLVTLIGNSRTGAEIDQDAVAARSVGVDQYCQTFQHPVQVGGSLNSTANYMTEPGVSTPFDQYRMDALQNLLDDIEYTSYYGLGDDGSVTSRPKQKGIRNLIASANRVTSPTNAGAYKPTDLIRDTVQLARAGGGEPDVLMVSTDFMTGFATWGLFVQRLEAAATVFGVTPRAFSVPFLGNLTIIEAPLLNAGTACCLTSSQVRMRMKRNEFWQPRGVRGDAIEADWIAEGAVELANSTNHAWVEDITAFSNT